MAEIERSKVASNEQSRCARYGRTTGGSPPPLIDLTDIKQVAVEALGEEAAERFWHEGQSMSLEEAVVYLVKDPEA